MQNIKIWHNGPISGLCDESFRWRACNRHQGHDFLKCRTALETSHSYPPLWFWSFTKATDLHPTSPPVSLLVNWYSETGPGHLLQPCTSDSRQIGILFSQWSYPLKPPFWKGTVTLPSISDYIQIWDFCSMCITFEIIPISLLEWNVTFWVPRKHVSLKKANVFFFILSTNFFNRQKSLVFLRLDYSQDVSICLT